MSATFASLRYRNYRLWFGGALVANLISVILLISETLRQTR